MSLFHDIAGVAGRVAASCAGSQRLLILTYHRVLAEPDPLLPAEPCRRVFAAHIALLKRHFSPLALEEATERLRTRKLPARAVCVTFDDGYADNFLNALPILESFGVPATCFIATDYMDGGCMFNDRVIEALRRWPARDIDVSWLGLGKLSLATPGSRHAAVGRILEALKYLQPDERSANADRMAEAAGAGAACNVMMTETQVSQLANRGVSIGAHTCSHPILAKLADAEARREISESRSRLESLLGRPVRLFAYPNGRSGRDFTARDVDVVRSAGFSSAVTTDWGCTTPVVDPFLLPRINVAGYRGALLGLRLGRYFFS